MALYAIGDVQGCDNELAALLEKLDFQSHRDQLWFVGDLVNRGPHSLQVLRRVRALGDRATVTLGNHDLHLLAVALAGAKIRRGDTLESILTAPDRTSLLDWLISRPVLHEDPALGIALLHAGLPPQWDMPTARGLARELEKAIQFDPEALFAGMYGDQPNCWSDDLGHAERLRFTTNCFTRLRFINAKGQLVLNAKSSPKNATTMNLVPWFEAPGARWRGGKFIFGHWSTLGYFRNNEVIALDTGCVWGGSLTAVRLDPVATTPVQVACARL